MRHIGRLGDRAAAAKLVDYLVAEGITALTDSTDGSGWDVWVKEEDQVSRARDELDRFVADPLAARYQSAAVQAEQVRQSKREKAAQFRRNVVDVRAKWSQPLLRRSPVVTLMIAASAAIFVLTGFGENVTGAVGSQLLFAWPPTEPGLDSVFRDILRGEVWRLVTPVFMHGNLLHILFNMYLLYLLGTVIETRHGSLFLVALVVTSAAISNAAQAISLGQTMFLGMSGVGYALFGYVWIRSWADPASGYRLNSQGVAIMLIWLVLGFVAEFSGQDMGVLSSLANWAHLGGLFIGGLWGLMHRG